jgi:hypothetical protein
MMALVITALIPDNVWLDYWRVPKFLNGTHWLLLIAASLIFIVSSIIFRAKSITTKVELSLKSFLFLRRCGDIFFYLTIFVYFIWFIVAVARGLRPEIFLSILQGDNAALLASKYIYFEKISGVTTWVQLAIPAAAVSTFLVRLSVSKKVYLTRLVVLVALAVSRALLMAERMAIIEVVLASVVVALSVRPLPREKVGLRFWQVFVIFWVGVIGFFGAFEAIRSWASYYSGTSSDYFGFLIARLAGYYSTAINNAALANQTLTWEENLGNLFHSNLFSDKNAVTETLLVNANLEFNNVSGMLAAFGALGVLGGFALIFAMARGFYWLFRRTEEGDILSLFIYACSSISILELSRFYYLGDGRFLPVLVSLVYLGIGYRKTLEPQPNYESANPYNLSPASPRPGTM